MNAIQWVWFKKATKLTKTEWLLPLTGFCLPCEQGIVTAVSECSLSLKKHHHKAANKHNYGATKIA